MVLYAINLKRRQYTVAKFSALNFVPTMLLGHLIFALFIMGEISFELENIIN